MAQDNSLVPVPYNAALLNQKGNVSMAWAGWFRSIYQILSGNGEPDPAPTVCPPGMIAENGAVEIPTGWLSLASPMTYSCADHPDLAAKLWNGSSFKYGGSGNPASGTFNTPVIPSTVYSGATVDYMIKT